MFRYFFSCLSGYETYRYLDNKYNYNINYNTIRRRLKNPAYTGMYKDIPDYRPAYITQEQYELILRISLKVAINIDLIGYRFFWRTIRHIYLQDFAFALSADTTLPVVR